MNLLKKLSVALVALAALCGCGEKEDPSKIYTIVLNNGKIQRTLKIPGAYIQTKNESQRVESGLWVGFTYPSMQPFGPAAPTEDSVALYIKLAVDASRPSWSELTLDGIKRKMNNPPSKNPARYVGKSGVYDVYEEEHTKTHSVSKTYFTHDRDGNLLSFVDDNGYRIEVNRRYAGVLELHYLFSRPHQSQQLEIDSAVTKIVDAWLQK